MKKIVIFLGCVFILAACTNKQLYQNGQKYQEDQCLKKAQNSQEYNQCLNSNKKSYEEYIEERNGVINR